jgi:hypothetical protein
MTNRLVWVLPGIALVALALFLRSKEVERSRAADSQAVLSSPSETPAIPVTAPIEPSEPEPVVIYQTNQFHWSQIESADYRQYIANLRSIGCPEPTIRDILLTDLMKYFAGRRGQLRTRGREFKFWETNDKRILKAGEEADYHEKMEGLDRELPAVVRELLGINYEREVNKLFIDTQDDAERLKFLDPDKQARIVSLREQYEGLQERIMESAQNGELSAADFALMETLQQAQKNELAGLLSPEELEEYELRTSRTAERLRDDLVGFEPTEEEFRTLFRAYRELDEKYGSASLDDPAVQARKLEEQRRIEAAVKEELAGSRREDFERAQDPDYRILYRIAQRHELDPDTARAMFDARRVAETERERLLKETSFLPHQRESALQALQRETELFFQEEMGSSAFREYREGPGAGWFEQLVRDP